MDPMKNDFCQQNPPEQRKKVGGAESFQDRSVQNTVQPTLAQRSNATSEQRKIVGSENKTPLPFNPVPAMAFNPTPVRNPFTTAFTQPNIYHAVNNQTPPPVNMFDQSKPPVNMYDQQYTQPVNIFDRQSNASTVKEGRKKVGGEGEQQVPSSTFETRKKVGSDDPYNH